MAQKVATARFLSDEGRWNTASPAMMLRFWCARLAADRFLAGAEGPGDDDDGLSPTKAQCVGEHDMDMGAAPSAAAPAEQRRVRVRGRGGAGGRVHQHEEEEGAAAGGAAANGDDGEEWDGAAPTAGGAASIRGLRLKSVLRGRAQEKWRREQSRNALPSSVSDLLDLRPRTLVFAGANFLGAKAQRGSKGAPPTRTLLRALASRHVVVLLDECLSSQTCCRSMTARHPHVTDAEWRDGRFVYPFWRDLGAHRGRRTLPPAPRKTFKSRYCTACHLHVHADVNAACNLLLDGLRAVLQPRGGRAPHLRRYAGSRPHRQLAPGVYETPLGVPRRWRTAKHSGGGAPSGGGGSGRACAGRGSPGSGDRASAGSCGGRASTGGSSRATAAQHGRLGSGRGTGRHGGGGGRRVGPGTQSQSGTSGRQRHGETARRNLGFQSGPPSARAQSLRRQRGHT